jgi:hypothetical protein
VQRQLAQLLARFEQFGGAFLHPRIQLSDQRRSAASASRCAVTSENTPMK